jgi:hypothetical protein
VGMLSIIEVGVTAMSVRGAVEVSIRHSLRT